MKNNESEKMIFRKLAQSLENIVLIQKELVIKKTLNTEMINKTIENLNTVKTLFTASEESENVQYIINSPFNRISFSYLAVFSYSIAIQ